MKIIPVHASRNYNIYIDHQLFQTNILADFCKKINKKIVLITDQNLKTLSDKLQMILNQQNVISDLFVIPAGEIYKTRETKIMIEDYLLAKGYGRDTCLLALGGGVITDLVGFVAATYCRGIPVIYLPTTLLAMIDASMGGKTAVNTAHGKNLIGVFSQPYAVLMDTAVLATLSPKEMRNGMAEIIKYAAIADKELFAKLKIYCASKNAALFIDIIYQSCLIKKNIIEQDEYEIGERQLLNFGHTIGHAIEHLENYQVSHGEAVAIGMIVEIYLSRQLGYCSNQDYVDLMQLLCDYHLPLKTTAFIEPDKMLKCLTLDKKSIARTPRFVLLEALGQARIVDKQFSHIISMPILQQTLAWAANFFG